MKIDVSSELAANPEWDLGAFIRHTVAAAEPDLFSGPVRLLCFEITVKQANQADE